MANGDPFWLIVKRLGKCARKECARMIVKGDRAFYYPLTHSIFCDNQECGWKESRAFDASRQDERSY